MDQASDTNADVSVRYGLTALGRKALAEALDNEAPAEPLRRLRRARARVRLLARVTRRG